MRPTVGDARCYIGEADVVADRLRHHHRDKDFWDRVVVITSKDTNLTKSHGRYLEPRLIWLATQATNPGDLVWPEVAYSWASWLSLNACHCSRWAG